MDKKAGVDEAKDPKTDPEQSVTSEVTETDYTSGDKEPPAETQPRPVVNKKGESKSSATSGKKEAKKQKKQTVQSGVLFEPCVFGKSKLWLPQVFTSDTNIFNDVMSMGTWQNELTSEERSALTKLLPEYVENNEGEQEETLRKLFDGDNFRFGNPLHQFGRDLRDGRYRVENVEKQRAWDNLQREEYRLQNSHRLQTMLPEVIVKRQELLEVVQFTSPSAYIRRPQQRVKTSKIDTQVKQKYEKLLDDLSKELGESIVSDDEDMENGTSSNEDVSQPPWEDRLHNLFDSPAKISHCTTTPKPVEAIFDDEKDESKPEAASAADVVTEKDYMRMLERLQIVKEDGIEHPEFIYSHITLRDIINRTYPVRAQTVEESTAFKRKQKRGKEDLRAKKKKRTPTSSPKPSTPVPQEAVPGTEAAGSTEANPVQPEIVATVKKEEAPSTVAQPELAATIPIKQEETVQPAPIHGSTEGQLNKVQYQVPHSFFALLRKHFSIAMNHKIWVKELQEKVSIWEKSPLSALCPWRPLQLTWSKVVENTLYFLSLEEQGRLVNYVEEEDAWVWPDPMTILNDELTMLFKRWLDLMLRVQPMEVVQTLPPVVPPMVTSVYGKEGTIPEPRMYTDYVVKRSTEEEIQLFRAQERQRFSEPHKPFTYVQHGYESVVGPVKGITPNDPLPASKGREHSLLISDRPSYVTILSLVRDAVARLPNGEGTKVEICRLLKASQFLATDPESSLLAAVSGALDRLHNENDPSVKFDSSRKLWVYLHRNRSVKDFERIQMEQILAGKTKRASTKPKQARTLSVDLPVDLASHNLESTSPSMELPSYNSPGCSRSLSPRIQSPRMSTGSIDVNPLSSPSVNAPTGIPSVFVDPNQSHQSDPNLSTTIQSLISESLIKSQLSKKPRSKTPPASLGRSSTFTTQTGKEESSPGGIQRSLSIPADWPKSAAGDLIPSDALVSRTAVAKPQQDGVVTTQKKPPDPGSKPRANSPRTTERKGSSGGKTSGGGKTKSKGEKSSKSSKSPCADKKSPTVQLKSGAITVTLPSSALKGQTVRSILASAASITIGKSQGEEQSHPTVQAMRKRLMAEKGQSVKTKHAKHSDPQGKTAGEEASQVVGHVVATQVPAGTQRTGLPTIILGPNQGFIGAPGKEGLVPGAQIASQPLALVGAKPAGVITGLAAAPATSKQIPLSITGIAAPPTSKQIPLSLVVSGSTSRGSPTISKPFLQQGGIPMTTLTPGQNIILQMPDGSKFVTSIPASKPPVRKPAPIKIPRQSPASHQKRQMASPQQVRSPQGRTLASPTQSLKKIDEEQKGSSAGGQSRTYEVTESSTRSISEQVQSVPSNPMPVQRFALNLVTKPAGESKPANQESTGAQAIVKTQTDVGTIGGTSVKASTSSGASQSSTGVIVSPVSQSISVSQSDSSHGVSQLTVIKEAILSEGLAGTGNVILQGEKSADMPHLKAGSVESRKDVSAERMTKGHEEMSDLSKVASTDVSMGITATRKPAETLEMTIAGQNSKSGVASVMSNSQRASVIVGASASVGSEESAVMGVAVSIINGSLMGSDSIGSQKTGTSSTSSGGPNIVTPPVPTDTVCVSSSQDNERKRSQTLPSQLSQVRSSVPTDSSWTTGSHGQAITESTTDKKETVASSQGSVTSSIHGATMVSALPPSISTAVSSSTRPPTGVITRSSSTLAANNQAISQAGNVSIVDINPSNSLGKTSTDSAQSVHSHTQSTPAITQSLSLNTQSVPTSTKGVTSNTQGVPTNTQRGPATTIGSLATTHSVATHTQGVTTQGMPADTKGSGAPTQGVSTYIHGVHAHTQNEKAFVGSSAGQSSSETVSSVSANVLSSPRSITTATGNVQGATGIKVSSSPQSTTGNTASSTGLPSVSQASPGTHHTASPNIRSPTRIVRNLPAVQQVVTSRSSSVKTNPQGTTRVIRQLPPRHQPITRVVRQRIVTKEGLVVPQNTFIPREAGRRASSETSTRPPGPQSVIRTSTSQSAVRATPGSQSYVRVSSAQPLVRTLSAQSTARTPSVHSVQKRGPSVQSGISRGLVRRGLTPGRSRGATGTSSVRVTHRTHSSPGILRKPQDPSRKTVILKPPLRLTQPGDNVGAGQELAQRPRSAGNERRSNPIPVASRDIPEDLSMRSLEKKGDGTNRAQPVGAEKSGQMGLGKGQTVLVETRKSGRTEGKVANVLASTISGAGSSMDGEETMKTAKTIKSQELADAEQT